MRHSVIVALAVAGVVFLGGAGITAVGVVELLSHRAHAPLVYDPAAHPKSDWRGNVTQENGTSVGEDDEDSTRAGETKLPNVARDIPIFQVRLLDGCSKTELATVQKSIDDAIALGAPRYNEGDFAGCYATYESTARTIERDIGKTCKGPASALRDGRARASTRKTAAESAWAMRDAFDGILDVIERQGPEL